MQFRLIESGHKYGLYGRIISAVQLSQIPYYDRSLFEPVQTLEQFDIHIRYYHNRQLDMDNVYAFYSNERGEIMEAKHPKVIKANEKPSPKMSVKIIEVISMDKIKHTIPDGYCILVTNELKE